MATKVTPLYSPDDTPLCTLLEFGGCSFLLDCGWKDSFDPALLEPLKTVVAKVDVVLLSHPDTEHLGALPYAVCRLGLKASIYATQPVVKMGQMFLYDHCESSKGNEDSIRITLDEVDAAFSKVKSLKYSEEHYLPEHGLTLTAHVAGHMVGGTAWQIAKDEQEIVYVVDYNHRTEKHLTAFKHSSLTRPAVLITDATDVLSQPVEYRKRDKTFYRTLLSVLKKGGNVLIPVDTAGRVLELIFKLEKYWSEHRLPYVLVLLSKVAYSMIEFAKSQLEWMNTDVTLAFERDRDNPYNLRYMQVCHNVEELSNLPSRPKVVLASSKTMESGLSRELFVEWASVEKNMILLPELPKANTLAQKIYDHCKTNSDDLGVNIKIAHRIPLEEDELKAYEQGKDAEVGVTPQEDALEDQQGDVASALDQETSLGHLQRSKHQKMEDLKEPEIELDTMDEEEFELETSYSVEQPLRQSSANISRLVRQPSGCVVQVLGDEVVTPGSVDWADVLIDGFVVPKGAAIPMFPCEDEEEEWDDYGEVFHTDAFFCAAAVDDDSDLMAVAPEVPQHVEEKEKPTKTVWTENQVTVHAQVQHVDFAGRTDGRFIKHMISDMGPRHIIVIRGSLECTEAFRQMVEGELIGPRRHVHFPNAGEKVDVSSGSNSFPLIVSDALMKRMQLRQVKEYQLGWVEGQVGKVSEGATPMLQPLSDKATCEVMGGVFIGDVRLSGAKAALEEAGVTAQFHGRSLVCSGDIQIRVEGPGRIAMEGPLSVDYYRVRDIVYGQYHVC